jgi:cytoskeletal protein CcmA (bactofilin family)
VARNRRFDGLLTFRGRAQIEGEVRGQVFCRGTLRLGPDSLVTGVIDADELIVSGRLQGEATARQRIELSPSARVEGVIRAPRLLLADGCQLEGRCEMLPATEHDAESALPEPRLPEPRLPEPRETGAKRSEG